MKRLIVPLFLLGLFCMTLPARAVPDKILARNGEYILTQSDMNLYYQILSFMIESELNEVEKRAIKTEVIAAFKEYPQQIEAECWALTETLALLKTDLDHKKVIEIRDTLFETLNEYEKKNNQSSFVQIVRTYRPDKFYLRK